MVGEGRRGCELWLSQSDAAAWVHGGSAGWSRAGRLGTGKTAFSHDRICMPAPRCMQVPPPRPRCTSRTRLGSSLTRLSGPSWPPSECPSLPHGSLLHFILAVLSPQASALHGYGPGWFCTRARYSPVQAAVIVTARCGLLGAIRHFLPAAPSIPVCSNASSPPSW